jgi:hypothetical protein
MGTQDIASTLRLFDRKERHLVVQACLGEASSTLSEKFRHGLTTLLQDKLLEPVRPDAWWATDYHLEWLAGALVWHAEHGPEDRERPRKNTNDLIRDNQEDIDLIVASGGDVILVEAKGHLSFGNSQLESKIRRLSTLCDRESGIVAGGNPAFPIRLHFVLMSIRRPSKVNLEGWPAWTLSGDGPYWMPLRATGDRIRVGRCDSDGRTDAKGGHWHMWREPEPNPPSS